MVTLNSQTESITPSLASVLLCSSLEFIIHHTYLCATPQTKVLEKQLQFISNFVSLVLQCQSEPEVINLIHPHTFGGLGDDALTCDTGCVMALLRGATG